MTIKGTGNNFFRKAPLPLPSPQNCPLQNLTQGKFHPVKDHRCTEPAEKLF